MTAMIYGGRWAIFALATAAACSEHGDDFFTEVHRVMDATALSQLSGTSVVELPPRGLTRTATWQRSLSDPWPTYCKRLRTILGNYHEILPPGGSPRFVRSAAGDAYFLTVEKLEASGTLEGRFTLTGMPD